MNRKMMMQRNRISIFKLFIDIPDANFAVKCFKNISQKLSIDETTAG